MRKPKILARPKDVAETRNEKVISFEFPNGKKGKISFHCNPETGGGSVMFYDCDPGVIIYASQSNGTIYTADSRKKETA